MKKTVCLITAAMLAAGCTPKAASAPTPTPAAPIAAITAASAAPSAETLREADQTEQDQILHAAIAAYNTVLDESLGAVTDDSQRFYPLYDSDEEAASSFFASSASAILPADEIDLSLVDLSTGMITSGKYQGKYMICSFPELYAVTNYRTLQEMTDSLDQVLDRALYSAVLAEDFLEHSSGLYVISTDRERGSDTLDETTLTYDEATGSGNSWLIMKRDTVNGTEPEQVRLTFEQVNGSWKLMTVEPVAFG